MGKFGDERFAKLRATPTAVLSEKQHQLAQCADARALDHLPSPLLGYDETSSDEYGEVTGKGALAEARRVDQLPGGKPTGLAADETAKRVEACGMCEGGERSECCSGFHSSAITDAFWSGNFRCVAER
jgi:hypothetical protein